MREVRVREVRVREVRVREVSVRGWWAISSQRDAKSGSRRSMKTLRSQAANAQLAGRQRKLCNAPLLVLPSISVRGAAQQMTCSVSPCDCCLDLRQGLSGSD